MKKQRLVFSWGLRKKRYNLINNYFMRQRAYVKISGKREVWGVKVALVADRMAKVKLSTG